MKRYLKTLCCIMTLILVVLSISACNDQSVDNAIETVKTGYLGEFTDMTVAEILDGYYGMTYENMEWNGGFTDDGDILVEVKYTSELLDPVTIQFTMLDEECFKVTTMVDPSMSTKKPSDVAALLNYAYYFEYIINNQSIVGNFDKEFAFIDSLSPISGGAVIYGASASYGGDRAELYQLFGDKQLEVNVPFLLDSYDLLDLGYYLLGTDTTDSADEYIGFWEDSYSQRCHLTITAYDETQFSVEVEWSSSATMTTRWNMIGHYNNGTGALDYKNCVEKNVEYSENGNETEEILYVDGTGSFYLSDGYLYWNDEKEHTGDNCIFEKSGSEVSDNSTQDILLNTEYFSVTLPSSWGDHCLYDDSGYSLSFYEMQSYYDLYEEGGFLFSIGLIADTEYEQWPETFVLGTFEIPNEGSFYVAVTFPSDVQYSDAGQDDYMSMNSDISGILDSFTPIGNCSWDKW